MPTALYSRPDGKPVLMGVLNVTPDSFSDGGDYSDVDRAVSRALEMFEQGADIVDVGGESTRPGSAPVSPQAQIDRVAPVIEKISDACNGEAVISIDTSSAEVAIAALSSGARIVNDITAGSEPALLSAVGASDAGLILMHMQGTPATMQDAPEYKDVVHDITEFLLERAETANSAGVARDRIAIDPGIGFGKTRVHNLTLLAALPSFVGTGYPVLLGTSRKRFMGAICDETVPTELVGATCATTALGVNAGVQMFRVHDVKANRQAADVAWALQRAGLSAEGD